MFFKVNIDLFELGEDWGICQELVGDSVMNLSKRVKLKKNRVDLLYKGLKFIPKHVQHKWGNLRLGWDLQSITGGQVVEDDEIVESEDRIQFRMGAMGGQCT